MNDTRRCNPQEDKLPGRNTKSAQSKLFLAFNNCDFDLFWYSRINFVVLDEPMSYRRPCNLFFWIYHVH